MTERNVRVEDKGGVGGGGGKLGEEKKDQR